MPPPGTVAAYSESTRFAHETFVVSSLFSMFSRSFEVIRK